MDGVLVVDKPAGPTSHDVVERVRRALAERRVGHTGTLDPFATGVLPLCLGKATRLARFLSAGDKVYTAVVRLGFATRTDDADGEPLGEPSSRRPSRDEVAAALAGLVGSFDQVPPAFSAKRVAGRRLYQLARRGEFPPRAANRVTVHSLELLQLEGDRLELEVRCSAGTYVRAIARDLGERLGTGGHLSALRRTRSGAFDLSQAVPADDLAAATPKLLPLRQLLPELPAVEVLDEGRALLRHGRDLGPGAVAAFPATPPARVRLLDGDGELLALAVPLGFEAGPTPFQRWPVLHPDVVLLDVGR